MITYADKKTAIRFDYCLFGDKKTKKTLFYNIKARVFYGAGDGVAVIKLSPYNARRIWTDTKKEFYPETGYYDLKTGYYCGTARADNKADAAAEIIEKIKLFKQFHGTAYAAYLDEIETAKKSGIIKTI